MAEQDGFKKKHKDAEGHEIPLASMIKNEYAVEMVLMSGVKIFGTVMSFDKFSITIRSFGHSSPTTFFKHAIASFTRED